MAKHHGESSKMGQVGPFSKQLQVGCKYKLAHKLLEPLMRSATTNNMSMKFTRKFAEGIEKLAGNMSGDYQKKTIGLIARMPEAARLAGVRS
ncbi:hypothetical protein BHM03_00039341 [Ensete ventricosum]|nr:hypothetical protein BHM03_00039341 [Ensete ventricosum]